MTKNLLKAAAAGQNIKLENLLGDGADINFLDKTPGRTALIEASIAGHVSAVDFLIEHGANMNLTDRTLGYTALGWAASKGYSEIVKRLIAAGAEVDLTASEYQHTPLLLAAREGAHDVVDLLLEAGANIHLQTAAGDNALTLAEANDHVAVASVIRAHGAKRPDTPQEKYLPWPTGGADILDVDATDPTSVLRGFILAMHRWEVACMQTIDDEQIDIERFRMEQDQIFARFCTPKRRAYGRLGSFSSPPDYAPEECLVSVDTGGNRSEMMTRQCDDRAMRYENLYILIRNNGRWLVDGKKSRSLGTKTWKNDIL